MASFPSSVPNVTLLPSGETRGVWYEPEGSLRLWILPARSVRPKSDVPAPAYDAIPRHPGSRPGRYTSDPLSDTLKCAAPDVPMSDRLTPSSTGVGPPRRSRVWASKGTARIVEPTA